VNIRNVAKRAALTFFETALGLVLVSQAGFMDVGVLQSAAVAGIAAALSVVYNAVVEYRSATTD
jgi:hypothetical protein